MLVNSCFCSQQYSLAGVLVGAVFSSHSFPHVCSALLTEGGLCVEGQGRATPAVCSIPPEHSGLVTRTTMCATTTVCLTPPVRAVFLSHPSSPDSEPLPPSKKEKPKMFVD